MIVECFKIKEIISFNITINKFNSNLFLMLIFLIVLFYLVNHLVISCTEYYIVFLLFWLWLLDPFIDLGSEDKVGIQRQFIN